MNDIFSGIFGFDPVAASNATANAVASANTATPASSWSLGGVLDGLAKAATLGVGTYAAVKGTNTTASQQQAKTLAAAQTQSAFAKYLPLVIVAVVTLGLAALAFFGLRKKKG